ncbi:hypothetical protein H4R18_003481 [Coemansia javaensis]|uniref:C2H2-type domain-containing protein n=1 Tax=Coemansia javaensis TaxID=2761396 RepID=A0A9W8LG95_9FUNG|nr:hypothetical protein H4R18_003481 [Coemansia javaensis]
MADEWQTVPARRRARQQTQQGRDQSRSRSRAPLEDRRGPKDSCSEDESDDDDDDDRAAGFPPAPVSVRCPFCPAGTGSAAFAGAAGVDGHLRTAHGLALPSTGRMALLAQRYLDAWAEQPGDDGAICERVQREGLQAALEAQAAERRGAALAARKCLFCRRVCETRAELFRHGYHEHGFNIGLPDNLVHVDEFLAILEAKLDALQCLYCERTYTSQAVLRRHMRKKRHFRVSAHNHLYDRFYMVNYLEPGRSGESGVATGAVAAEQDDEAAEGEEAGPRDESWSDWSDRADLPTQSLFDDRVLPSADECWEYMRAEYAFDLARIRADHALDFYRTVALVNAIRRCSAAAACFACSARFADRAALAAHIRHAGPAHLVPPPADSPLWASDHPAPAVQDDPLLMAIDDDDDSSS